MVAEGPPFLWSIYRRKGTFRTDKTAHANVFRSRATICIPVRVACIFRELVQRLLYENANSNSISFCIPQPWCSLVHTLDLLNKQANIGLLCIFMHICFHDQQLAKQDGIFSHYYWLQILSQLYERNNLSFHSVHLCLEALYRCSHARL